MSYGDRPAYASPRRILYVQNAPDLYGASRALLHLLEALDRNSFTPLVALPGEGPLANYLRALNVETIIAPYLRVLWGSTMRSWRIVPFGAGLLPSALATRRLIRQHEIDLVHSNTWTVLSGAMGARLANIPHIWHIREILPNMGGLKPALVAFTLRNTERLVCISNAVAAQFAPQAAPGMVQVIYDGLPLPATTISPTEAARWRQQYGIDQNNYLIGIVGRLHPQKGQADLLRAYALLPAHVRERSQIVIVGDTLPGQEGIRGELEALAQELGIAKYIQFLGFLQDVRPLVAAFDVLVLPATRPEGLGGVLLEAMIAGVPAIATRAGGPSEVIQDGVSGFLVAPQRPDELARRLEQLFDDPLLRRSMGAVGRQVFERRFNASTMAAEVEQLYRSILYT